MRSPEVNALCQQCQWRYLDYERHSVAISDYVESLNHDTRLVRESTGTPKDVDIYGYVYNIDTNELSLVTVDKGA